MELIKYKGCNKKAAHNAISSKVVLNLKKSLCLLLMIVTLFGLTGCGSEAKKESEKIELTSENFNDYVSLSAGIENFELETQQTDFFTNYRGVADLVAKAELKKDVKAEDVVIKGQVTVGEVGWSFSVYDFTLELDKDGKATFTKQITSGDFGMMKSVEPSLQGFYTYELKKDEFFLNDKRILITSLSGSVTEE